MVDSGGVPTTLGGKGRQRLGVAATPQQLGLTIQPLKILHTVKSREAFAAGARPGTFEFKKRNLGEHVDLIFLLQKNVRVYQVRDHDKVQTLCASVDGIVPIAEAPVPQAERCGICPRAAWTDQIKDGQVVLRKDGSGRPKQDPPDCTSGFAFLAIFTEESPFAGNPCWFLCKGTAEKPAREFLREWDSQGMTALFEWRVRLGLQEDRSGGLVWYLPTFQVIETYPLERWMPAYEAARSVEYVHFIGRDAIEVEEDERPVRPASAPAAGWRDDAPPPSDDDACGL
jgi:hypothetical protein